MLNLFSFFFCGGVLEWVYIAGSIETHTRLPALVDTYICVIRQIQMGNVFYESVSEEEAEAANSNSNKEGAENGTAETNLQVRV